MRANWVLFSGILAICVLGGIVFFLMGDDQPRLKSREDAMNKRGAAEGLGGNNETEEIDGDTTGDLAADSSADSDEELATSEEVEAIDDRPVSLRGRIVDTRGEGVAEALIVLMGVSDWTDEVKEIEKKFRDPIQGIRHLHAAYSKKKDLARTARSSADGSFEFRGLGSHEFGVFVSHPDFFPHRGTQVVVPPTGEKAAEVEILLVDARSIRGRVLDRDENPVAGVNVSALTSEEAKVRGMGKMLRLVFEMFEGEMINPAGRNESDENGSFRLGSLEPDLYDVTARKAGYAPTVLKSVMAGSDEIVLVLNPGIAVSGRVLDPGGDVVADVEVLLREPPKNLQNMNPQLMAAMEIDFLGDKTCRSRTLGDGTFVVSGLQKGYYELQVISDDYPLFTKLMRVEERSEDVGDVTLEAPRALGGRVLRPDGGSLAGAEVSLYPGGSKNLRNRGTQAIKEAVTDDRGDFELSGLGKGTFDLRVKIAEFGERWLEKVEAGRSNLSIQFERGLSVRGVILAEEDRSPIEGAKVSAWTGAGMAETRSDADGNFVLGGVSENDIPDGEKIGLNFMHPTRGSEVIHADPRSIAPIEVLLANVPGFSGIVLTASGEPAAGARIEILMPGIPPLFQRLQRNGEMGSRANEVGEFYLPGLAGNRRDQGLELVATHRAGVGRISLVELGGEGAEDVRIVLVEPVSLGGTVTDSSGAALSGVRIYLMRKSTAAGNQGMAQMMMLLPTRPDKAGYSDDDGKYRIIDLEVGTYKIEANATGYAKRIIDSHEIREGETRLDLMLDPGASIEGRVTDDAGEPIAQAEVVAFTDMEVEGDDPQARLTERFSKEMQGSGGLGIGSTRTDEEGKYELRHLPEVELVLVARKKDYYLRDSVTVEAGDRAPDLVLISEGSILGRVIDAQTGGAVTAFRVSLRGKSHDPQHQDLAQRMRLNEKGFDSLEGHFDIPSCVAGEYEILVQSDGYGRSVRRVTVTSGRESEIEFVLDSPGRIRGIVTQKDSDRTVSNITVNCSKVSRSPTGFGEWRDAKSDEDGYFEIDELGEGEFRLSLRHPHYYYSGSGENLKITVDPGAATEVKLLVSPAARLHGKIRRAQSNREGEQHYVEVVPISGTRPEPSPRGFRARVHVNHDERYDFQGLRPGKYHIELVVQTHQDSGVGGRRPVESSRNVLGDIEVESMQTYERNFDSGL